MSDPERIPPASAIGEADAVLLSAYLDHELSPAEREALEKRLEAEPALKAELEGLRASGEALRKVDALAQPSSPESVTRLVGIRRKLREDLPDEHLPVAHALRPSRIRQVALVGLAGVAAIGLLSLLFLLLQSLGLPTPCGWSTRPLEGKVAIERHDRIVLALDRELLLVGDRIHLDQGEHAELDGPAKLRVTLTGPAMLHCDAHGGLFLECGHARIEGTAGSSSALNLRTPEGRIQPEGNEAFNFEVAVKEGSRH